MSQEMNFDWSSAYGEFPEDSMGRADHAKNLTRFLVHKGQEGSYVLNLNATWGTGKTYFLRRWVKEIEERYPAVYIDAWSSDHSSDPLLSVVSEVKKELHKLKNISEVEHRLFEGVAKTVKAAAPSLIKALINGQLKRAGINIDELGEVFSNEDVADAGAKLVELAINAHNDASEGVVNIKKAVQDWLASVVSNGLREYPLFIFIDELDRCRPTYAIEMLETIKHIFDMKNVVFVVATDKDQLQHSIKAIYGADFNSRLYLDRFFTRTVTLSNPSRSEFIQQKISSSETFNNYMNDDNNFAFIVHKSSRKEEVEHLLTGIADGFSWPLRTVNLWLDRLEAAIIMGSRKLDIIILSFMMALETEDEKWLKKFEKGVNIFSSTTRQNEGLFEFKDFKFTTSWNYKQIENELPPNISSHLSYRMNEANPTDVFLVPFINMFYDRISTRDNPISFIIQHIENRSHGNSGDAEYFSLVTSVETYPEISMLMYLMHHKKNGITINHYIEICRYSSFMS